MLREFQVGVDAYDSPRLQQLLREVVPEWRSEDMISPNTQAKVVASE
jgi:hypothetical protein